jgi:hypothetical protein
MNLFVISRLGTNQTTIKLLKEACTGLNINFNLLITEEFNAIHAPKLTENDMLYCLGDDYSSRSIEKLLINERVKTFYTDYTKCYTKMDDADDVTSHYTHKLEGLPTIETIPVMTSDRATLAEYVASLGGYPVILKAIGGTSHGVGIIRIDGQESLFSTVDFLISTGTNFLFKKYINVSQSIRVIVLGDTVIDSIEYITPEGDFRSNVGNTPNVRPLEIDEHASQIAVSAVNSLGFEFGGVDLLVDGNGDVHIAEVNFPCFFSRAQLATGKPLATKMLEHLASR